MSHGSEGWDWKYAVLAAANAQLGRMDEAARCAAEVLKLTPDFSIMRNMKREPFKREEDARHLIDAFTKAGLPE